MNKETFYITTTLPYVNAKPHIGFALEITEADVLARYQRMLGKNVVFNTGTDEHGIKIYRKAQELNKDAQEYCDETVMYYKELKDVLGLSFTNFIRTTGADHIAAAQEFWRRCETNGDIYKKNYEVNYCVGCELEKMDSELVDGMCPDHPKQELERIKEENYFFRFSRYQDKLLSLYADQADFVLPKKRLNEIRAFVQRGPRDFSISRLKEKMPWGVEVPGDPEHVMYVWFDALVNYISTIGWPNDMEQFKEYWPAVQIAGKDNLRQQSAMWQAMLMSAGIAPSKQILINGFVSVDGQKMSKSLGNVIGPDEMVEKYGMDGARYLILSMAYLGEDADISWNRLTEKYNADLANGLGNLVSRVLTLGKDVELGELDVYQPVENYVTAMEKARINESLEITWEGVRSANKFIEEEKPWELKKADPAKFSAVMRVLLEDIWKIAHLLEPILPETSTKMKHMIQTREKENLFGRL